MLRTTSSTLTHLVRRALSNQTTTATSFSFSSSAVSNNKKIVMDFDKVKAGLANQSFTLLDVRDRDEHLKERIPGSQNLPNSSIRDALALSDDDFAQQFGFDKPGKTDSLVVHCLKGGRAGKAAEVLKEMGYSNVQVYSGSFTDWKANNGPIESN